MTPEEFLKEVKVGVDWGPKPLRVIWTAPDGKHMVFTSPGHNYRSGQETKYGGASHYLVKLDVVVDTKHPHGHRLLLDAKIGEADGRMNKAKMAALIEKIPK